MMLPVDRKSVFSLSDEGFIVWCGTMTRGDDGKYYLYFSFWPKNKGHNAWLTHSMIGYAVSDSATGPFTYKGIALAGAGGDEWDRDCVHNPAVIKVDHKYYLYYMGNYGDGSYWDHRNHQRVGVAWADKPEGPFHRFDKPVIDITENAIDSLMTSNPTITRGPDGTFYLLYKAVENSGTLPKGGPVVCGIATSSSPLGPFKKYGKPLFVNPENDWAVEDPFIWYHKNKFYVIAKDFHGYFTKCGKGTVALFESDNAFDWKPSDNPLAYELKMHWSDGSVEPLAVMERPQIYIDEEGNAKVLMCACCGLSHNERTETFNVQIGLDNQIND